MTVVESVVNSKAQGAAFVSVLVVPSLQGQSRAGLVRPSLSS